MEFDLSLIDSIPDIEEVLKDEWEMYVNHLGPRALKEGKNGSFDLTLFWKAEANTPPELFKVASCYTATTNRSFLPIMRSWMKSKDRLIKAQLQYYIS